MKSLWLVLKINWLVSLWPQNSQIFRLSPNTDTEACLEPWSISKMTYVAKIVNGLKPLTILAKFTIFDVWQGYDYASEII